MTKPTYEELEKRVKELERAETESKWTEEKEKQFASDMVILSNTALGFVDLTLKDNIYHYIGKQLKKFAGVGVKCVYKTFGICLSNDNVNCLIEDSAGNYWIGTDMGLNKLNKNKGGQSPPGFNPASLN